MTTHYLVHQGWTRRPKGSSVEVYHFEHHEGVPSPPPPLPAPSNVPKVYEQRGIGGGRSESKSPFTEPRTDEIQPSARDFCECGHKRAQHVHSRQCAYCSCTSFRLAYDPHR